MCLVDFRSFQLCQHVLNRAHFGCVLLVFFQYFVSRLHWTLRDGIGIWKGKLWRQALNSLSAFCVSQPRPFCFSCSPCFPFFWKFVSFHPIFFVMGRGRGGQEGKGVVSLCVVPGYLVVIYRVLLGCHVKYSFFSVRECCVRFFLSSVI